MASVRAAVLGVNPLSLISTIVDTIYKHMRDVVNPLSLISTIVDVHVEHESERVSILFL